MKVDYKKELETASRGMIMIHDPKMLIKLIIRTLVRKIRLSHAAMILHDTEKDAFVLSISRGEAGVKVPAGYTKFTHDSPIIKLFSSEEFRMLTKDSNAIVTDDINRIIWRENVVDNGNGKEINKLLQEVNKQMKMFNTEACVPAYYQQDLMAVLLLGAKRGKGKFDQEELDFFAALASDAAMAIRNAQLFERLDREARINKELFINTIIVLGSAIEAKDKYTHGHTERVTGYSLAIAKKMIEKETGRI